MRKSTLKRMIKKVHQINESVLAFPIRIMKLKPLDQQKNYNHRLKDWFGPKDYDIIADTTGIFESYKDSEDWRENGMLPDHDYKCTINDYVNFSVNDIVECRLVRLDTKEEFEIVFKREYIGESVVGLRPVRH